MRPNKGLVPTRACAGHTPSRNKPPNMTTCCAEPQAEHLTGLGPDPDGSTLRTRLAPAHLVFERRHRRRSDRVEPLRVKQPPNGDHGFRWLVICVRLLDRRVIGAKNLGGHSSRLSSRRGPSAPLALGV